MANVTFGDFEWDSNKSEANREKHAIDFEEAVEIFDAPYLKVRTDRDGEIRWVGLGKAKARLVAVVFTERAGRVRIISARRARKKERETYEERIGDTS